MIPDNLGERLAGALRQRADEVSAPVDGAEQIARRVRHRHEVRRRRRVVGGGVIVAAMLVAVLISSRRLGDPRVDTQQRLGPDISVATAPTTGTLDPDGVTTTAAVTAPPGTSVVVDPSPTTGPPPSAPVNPPSTSTTAVVTIPVTRSPTSPPTSAPPVGSTAGVPWLTLSGLPPTSGAIFDEKRTGVYVDEKRTGVTAGSSAAWLSDDLRTTVVKEFTDRSPDELGREEGKTMFSDGGPPVYAATKPSGVIVVYPSSGFFAWYDVVGVPLAEAARLVQAIELVAPSSPAAGADPDSMPSPPAYPAILHTDGGSALHLAVGGRGGYWMQFKTGDHQVSFAVTPAGPDGWQAALAGAAIEPFVNVRTGQVDGQPVFMADRPSPGTNGVLAWSPNPLAVVVVTGDLSADDLLALVTERLETIDEETWDQLIDAVQPPG